MHESDAPSSPEEGVRATDEQEGGELLFLPIKMVWPGEDRAWSRSRCAHRETRAQGHHEGDGVVVARTCLL